MEAHQLLEHKFSEWAETRNVVACSSGTAALHLALEVLRAEYPPELRNRAEVILPDYTMVACARAVIMAGFKPVFADCDPTTLVVTANSIKARVTENTAAVMVVHVYGQQPTDMDEIANLCDNRALFLIEDLAEAHTTRPHWRTNAVCWSFYKNKIVRGEEGGAVAFPSDIAQADCARRLRSLGFTAEHNYYHVPRGHNYRLANALAELVLVHLREIESGTPIKNPKWNPNAGWLKTRSLIYGCWDLEEFEPWAVKLPPKALWVYPLRISNLTPEQQTRIVKALQAIGVAARFGFKPMTWQPEFSTKFAAHNPNAERAANEVFYLPIDPSTFDPAWPKKVFDRVSAELT